MQHGQISTLAWGNGNTIISYGYDANGSLTSKTTNDGIDDTEIVDYTYNLQNRLATVETTPLPAACRMRKDAYSDPQGSFSKRDCFERGLFIQWIREKGSV